MVVSWQSREKKGKRDRNLRKEIYSAKDPKTRAKLLKELLESRQSQSQTKQEDTVKTEAKITWEKHQKERLEKKAA